MAKEKKVEKTEEVEAAPEKKGKYSQMFYIKGAELCGHTYESFKMLLDAGSVTPQKIAYIKRMTKLEG